MNTDDEEEFEEFYDFSKTYENHPSVKQLDTDQTKKEVKEEAEWEDVDEEDGDEDEEEDTVEGA